MNERLLIFVYNANNSIFGSLTDFAHKTLSPATYPCQLCKLTYGNFSMKQEWKLFIATLPIRSVFLHKNEFLREYKMDAKFPAIFIKDFNGTRPFINKEEIEVVKSLRELEERLTDKLKKYDQHYHSNL